MLWNKINIIEAIFLLSVFMLSNSCSDDNIQTFAAQRTISEVINDWRYYGFEMYYNSYNPSDDYLDSLSIDFNPNNHKFVLFTSPSCFSCGQMDSLLPQTAKILKSAEILDTAYVLFDTPALSSSHPYDGVIFLKKLPSVYLLKTNTNTIYSILDTFQFRKSNSPETSLEKIMYESLK